MSNDPAPMSLTVRWTIPIFLFVGILLLVALTLKDYGVTWDEPPYFHATDLHMKWIAESVENFRYGELRKSIEDQNIKANWHWNPYNVPHPPFSRIVSGLAKEISAPFVDKFSAYRMGPALFFALLGVATYLWMMELFGRATGLFTALTLVLIPNLFGYAHIAVTDLPLATLWFLTTYCFWKGLGDWKWSVVLGVVWGLALSTKFPALLIPVPLILWAHLFHRPKYVNNLFAMICIAPLVMVATQPYLWHQTGLRVLEFLYEGVSRGYRPETNFGIYFFNEVILSSQLPRYYPFFIVGTTTPEPILVLAFLGCLSVGWMREQRSAVVLILANAIFVLLLGWMPGAVLHDGVRQMLSALPFLAALSGVGFFVVGQFLVNRTRNWQPLKQIVNIETKLIGLLILLLSFSPSLELYLSHPFQLSYYNRLVGGIRGAYERGLEMTYFMEAISPDFLRRLNEVLPANANVNASFATFMLKYYQKEGSLRRDIRIADNPPFDFFILLNRRSALAPRERILINGATKPYLAISVAGVPLVAAFELKQFNNDK